MNREDQIMHRHHAGPAALAVLALVLTGGPASADVTRVAKSQTDSHLALYGIVASAASNNFNHQVRRGQAVLLGVDFDSVSARMHKPVYRISCSKIADGNSYFLSAAPVSQQLNHFFQATFFNG
jgi:hypothetical protein